MIKEGDGRFYLNQFEGYNLGTASVHQRSKQLYKFLRQRVLGQKHIDSLHMPVQASGGSSHLLTRLRRKVISQGGLINADTQY